MNPNGAVPPKPETWYKSAETGPSVQGIFARLDCLGNQARLVIQAGDGKTVQLLVPDPSQIDAGGEQALTCGPQKNPRQVVGNAYWSLRCADGSAWAIQIDSLGEATAIEFH